MTFDHVTLKVEGLEEIQELVKKAKNQLSDLDNTLCSINFSRLKLEASLNGQSDQEFKVE